MRVSTSHCMKTQNLTRVPLPTSLLNVCPLKNDSGGSSHVQAGLLCVLMPECGAVSMAVDQTLISERKGKNGKKSERAGDGL